MIQRGCGAASPSQGPWDPDSLRPALSLGGQATAWEGSPGRSLEKNTYFCLIGYAKAFDCVDHNKLWKILKEMGIPDHLICLLRNLYADQEATVRMTWNNRLVPNWARGEHRGSRHRFL